MERQANIVSRLSDFFHEVGEEIKEERIKEAPQRYETQLRKKPPSAAFSVAKQIDIQQRRDTIVLSLEDMR